MKVNGGALRMANTVWRHSTENETAFNRINHKTVIIVSAVCGCNGLSTDLDRRGTESQPPIESTRTHRKVIKLPAVLICNRTLLAWQRRASRGTAELIMNCVRHAVVWFTAPCLSAGWKKQGRETAFPAEFTDWSSGVELNMIFLHYFTYIWAENSIKG